MIEISFVIPAFNEANNIGRTIESIKGACQRAGVEHEVIVVDNGSVDATPEIAHSLGATVLRHPGDTIGMLRNLGVNASSGKIIGFIDADVSLTDEWACNIRPVLNRIEAHDHLISGSHCSPPESNNLLLKHWFRTLALDPRNTHLGTGHLIVSRRLFLSIDGFDPSLKTGEDYDFCVRAKRVGGQIDGDPSLKVIHHDFPRSLYKFIRREAWHGKGDLLTLDSVMNSKVALASLAFLLMHVILVLGMLFQLNIWFALAIIFSLAGLLFLSSWIKSRHMSVLTVMVNTGVFYFYFWGRVFAISEAIKEKARQRQA